MRFGGSNRPGCFGNGKNTTFEQVKFKLLMHDVEQEKYLLKM